MKNTQDLIPSLNELNRAIGQSLYIVGPSLTLADFSVCAALQGIAIFICVSSGVAGGAKGADAPPFPPRK